MPAETWTLSTKIKDKLATFDNDNVNIMMRINNNELTTKVEETNIE